MTEQFFKTSYDTPGDLEDATSIKSRTVILRFSRANGGMFPLDSLIVGAAVTEVVQVTDVTALGCLRGNHEWHVTLATQEVADTLLRAGSVRARGPNQATRIAYLEPLVKKEVYVRVLWCPNWVFPDIVYEMLESIGEVSAFERCRARVGEYAIPNLQYTATLKKVAPSQVPDRVTLEAFGEKVPLLIITKGKPRCCFLCGSCSHTQASCPNPFCRYCNKRGHVVTNCPRRKQQNSAQSRPEQSEGEQVATSAAATETATQAAAQPVAQPTVQSAAQSATHPPVQPSTQLNSSPTVIPDTPRATRAVETPAPKAMDLSVDRDKRKRVKEIADREDEPQVAKKKENSKPGVLAVLPRAASLSLSPAQVNSASTDTESEVEEGDGA